MSSNVPISSGSGSDLTAPTPQNTPLTHAPIAAGLSRPTVPDISEDAEPDEGATSSEVQAAMLGMVQGKLAGLLGRSSGYIEGLADGVKKSVEALKGVQVKQNELQNKYKHECLELEKKVRCFRSLPLYAIADRSRQYLELSKPLYERRNLLISGAELPTEDELKAGAEVDKDNVDANRLEFAADAVAAGVPEFWLTALRNHVVLGDIITERDAGALKALRDVRIEYLPPGGKPGFKLLFEFAPNEFFENTLLEKTYVYQDEVGYTGDFVYDRAIGCEIKWKEDKDLTKEFEIKKQRNKSLLISLCLLPGCADPCAQTRTGRGLSARRARQNHSSTFSRRPCHHQRTRSRAATSPRRTSTSLRRSSRWTTRSARTSRRR
jgi:nucleosome assembly protein 1-like 1